MRASVGLVVWQELASIQECGCQPCRFPVEDNFFEAAGDLFSLEPLAGIILSRVSRSCSLVAFVILVSVASSLLMSKVLSCTLSSVDGRRPGRTCVALASQMMQAWSPKLAHYKLGGTSKAARR